MKIGIRLTPLLVLLVHSLLFAQSTTVPDPDLGLRAFWMKGTWGLN